MKTYTATHPRPIPLHQVSIKKGFWEERQTKNRETTIPAIYKKMEETGRIKAWTLAPDREPPPYHPVVHMFWDSDTGKWLEAVAYSLTTHPDPELQKVADDLIDLIETAQFEDGYLNTYFPVLAPDMQWKNLRDWHEMYNAGHLIEGAVAYFRATGQRKILDILQRFANLIEKQFGDDDGKKRGYPGHPELELAMVKLYRETGEQKYMDLATYFINERGQQPHYFDIEMEARGERPEDFHQKTYRYCQAHAPIREHEGATGHSVRACYLYAGLADVALETGDQELLDVSRRIWDDLTQHQMYVTGGLGPTNTNEGFTFAYDFPTETAYAETCASIALAFWAHRMFHLDPDRRYIDVMELAIYNGSLAGVSYDGDEFFYANPLASYPNVNPYDSFSGITTDQYYRREEWFYCPCCPPNLSRLIASIGEYTYSQLDNRVYVHLYHDNTVSLEVNGRSLTLEQSTRYPWDETVKLTVGVDNPIPVDIALRIPGWCYEYELSVNGEKQDAVALENGYAIVSREWADGDTIELTLSMPVERVLPHPEVRQAAGQIALQRGPIIFCLEEVDNGPRLANLVIPESSKLEASFDANLFHGVTVITGEAVRIEPKRESSDLYRHRSQESLSETSTTFKAIPYYLWANREPGEMRVWIRSS